MFAVKAPLADVHEAALLDVLRVGVRGNPTEPPRVGALCPELVQVPPDPPPVACQRVRGSGAPPLAALALLKANMPTDRVAWRKKARVAAVLGSCPRSQSSYRAGVKHWVEFIKITHGVNAADSVAFPPRLEDVLAWSNTFRYALP